MWKIITLFFVLPIYPEEVTLKNRFYQLIWDNDRRSPVQTKHLLHDSEKKLSRAGMYYKDDKRVDSFSTKSYRYSGYDRGHLVPAGDMNFSKAALKSTFLMTNMTPQRPEFNRGSWKNLEMQIRSWRRKKLEVITGVLFHPDGKIEPANGKIPVPDAFYKIIYCPQRQDSIAFILPNKANHQPLHHYTVDRKELEKLTGKSLPFPVSKQNGNWFHQPLLFYFNLSIFSLLYYQKSKRRIT